MKEFHHIESGAWFSKLSQGLRQDILAHARPRRLADGEAPAVRGGLAEECCGVVSDAVRRSTASLAGKQVTLTSAQPGKGFSVIALLDGSPDAHGASVQGQIAPRLVRKPGSRDLLKVNDEPYDELPRLSRRRHRLRCDHFDVFSIRPLQARLARQLLLLAKACGPTEGEELGIGRVLAQEDMAQLPGSSRLRINQELTNLERMGVLRVETGRLTVQNRDPLHALAEC